MRGIVDAMRDGVPLERMAVLVGNTEPYARLLHEHLDARRHRAQRRLGAHARRLGARPRRCCGCSRSPTTTSAATTCSRCSRACRCSTATGAPVPAVDVGAHRRATRESSAGSPSGARGSSTTRRRCDGPATTTGERRRARARSARCGGSSRSSPPISTARAAHVVGLARVGARARPPLLRRRARARAAGRRSSRRPRAGSRPWSTGSATLDAVDPAPDARGVPAHVRARARRRARSRRPPRRRRARRSGRAGARCRARPGVGVRAGRRPVPGAAARRSAARRRRSGGARRRAAAALRSHRRRRARAARRARRAPSSARVHVLPARRSAAQHRARAVAVPARHDRGALGRAPLGAISRRAVVHAVPSFVYGLTHVAFPANRHELDVRAALAGEPWVAAEPAVARGARARAARAGAPRSPASTATSRTSARALRGDEPGRAGRRGVGRPGSQTWATCPHAYFVKTVLHVAARSSSPEDIMQLTPIERGNVVHEVLDRFLARAASACAGVGRPWTRRAPGAPARDPARGACAETEARGLDRPAPAVGIATGASCTRSSTRSSTADERLPRRARIAETIATELAFGRRDGATAAIEVTCSDGRTRARRGTVDRVDRRADGGSSSSTTRPAPPTAYTQLSHDDPLLGGHAAAAPGLRVRGARRCSAHAGDEPVEASYWFVLREPKNRASATLVDAAVEDVLDDALRVDRRRDRSGRVRRRGRRSPAARSFIECHYCDPDGMGTTDRCREWQRKLAAPELADYRRELDRGRARRVTDQLASSGARRHAARDAIRTQLDATLFVEAGAGTGKTTVLVDRVVALVTADGPDLPVPMRGVAAITFTEKAAAELRDRVRGALETRSRRRHAGAERARPVRRRARRSRRRRDLHAALVRAAHPHRVPDRGRPAAAHRGPRRGLVALVVRRALAPHSSTSCSTIPSSSRRCSCCSPRARSSSICAGSRSTSTTTGTCSTASTSRRRLPALDARRPGSPSLDARVRDGRSTAATPTTSCSRASRSSPSTRDRLRAAVDDAARIELLLADEAVVQGRASARTDELARHRRGARPHREARRAARRR